MQNYVPFANISSSSLQRNDCKLIDSNDTSTKMKSLSVAAIIKPPLSLPNIMPLYDENKSYYCPLTHVLMCDPVYDAEGYSYEKTAILAHIDANSAQARLGQLVLSPMTGNPMRRTDLRPNEKLKKQIIKWTTASLVSTSS